MGSLLTFWWNIDLADFTGSLKGCKVTLPAGAGKMRFCSQTLLTTALLASMFPLAASLETTTVKKLQIRDPVGFAVCNDGSPAAVYYSPSSPSLVTTQAHWHIYLQGGGYCVDEQNCRATPKDLQSSLAWPAQHTLGGIFSRGSGATPGFETAAHVYFPYCSSDSWIGNTSVMWSNRQWHFRGAAILHAGFSMLLQRGLREARLVTISGCSAGGRGVLYNLDGLCGFVKHHAPRAHCTGVVDAAWWLDVAVDGFGKHVINDFVHMATEVPKLLGDTSKLSEPMRSCRAAAHTSHPSGHDSPTNLSAHVAEPYRVIQSARSAPELSTSVFRYDKCYFGPHLIQFLKTPVLLSVQLYDFFQLDMIVRRGHPSYIGGPMGGPLSRKDTYLAQVLRHNLQLTLTQGVVTGFAAHGVLRQVFAPACYGHCLQHGEGYFNVRLRSGPGAGMSLNDTVAAWLHMHQGNGNASLPAKVLMEEMQCGTVNCSNGCPRRTFWVYLLVMFLVCSGLVVASLYILIRCLSTCDPNAEKANHQHSQKTSSGFCGPEFKRSEVEGSDITPSRS